MEGQQWERKKNMLAVALCLVLALSSCIDWANTIGTIIIFMFTGLISNSSLSLN